jgi:hypothetical protein
MQKMAMDFFKHLYQADLGVSPAFLLGLIEQKISEEMNEDLCRDFSDDKIADALFQMSPLKAPGPDGFPACFFQRHWGTMKSDVIATVKFFCAMDFYLKVLMILPLC